MDETPARERTDVTRSGRGAPLEGGGRLRAPASALVALDADNTSGSTRRGWRGRGRLGPLGLVALAVGFSLWTLRSERLVVAYPNDSGMHLQMTSVAQTLLRHGIWPFDHWYPLLSLGSAFFVQYQSLSAVVTGAISILFGTPATYAWSLYILLALWPVCVYWSTRLLAWGRWEAALAAASAPLIFTVTGRGFGHQSYLWIGSGLWSQLWAAWTLPLAWAFSWRYVSQRKSLFAAVLTLSLTVALHFLSAYLCALTLVVWILIRPSQLLARTGRTLTLGVATLLSSAWVTVPLVVHLKWLAVNQFQVGTSINNSYGARQVMAWLLSGQLYDWRRLPVITILVGAGLVACVRRWSYDERARALSGAWLLSLLLFFGRTTWGPLLDILPGNQSLLFQRYIMGVHLAGLALAGVGAVALARGAKGQLSQRMPAILTRWRQSRLGRIGGVEWVRTTAALGVVILALTPAWTQIAAYDHSSATWITYQRSVAPTQGADVDALVKEAESLGAGRIYAGMPSNWGHQFYVGAVPVYIYLEQLGVDAVGFTLRTSGLMTDPEAYFDEFQPGDYSAFAVRYLLLPVGHRPPVSATLLRTAGPYRLWRVGSAATSSLIQVVDTYGTIAADNATLGTHTESFLHSNLPQRALYATIAFAGSPAAPPTLSSLSRREGVAGFVTSQSQDLLIGQRARAVVVARRRAVVLMKVAYDPGWVATVDGRSRPTIMLAPALIGVEVTPGHHVVRFTYHGYRHYPLLDVVAVFTLVAVALVPGWRRRGRPLSVARSRPGRVATGSERAPSARR